MKKKILVDMDGVLADVYAKVIEMQYTQRGIHMTEEQLNGIEEREACPDIVEIVSSKGFFRNPPVMDGAIEGLKYLNDKYDVLIVSSATEFPGCLDDKQAWLMEHFPFISWRQMIFCGVKSGIKGDIMLDDHPKNLDFFDGVRYLFTQPHNYFLKNESYHRVNSWSEIMNCL
ncbi:MAG: 5' nucleotidase, NT5C type [Phocaeicola sp.]